MKFSTPFFVGSTIIVSMVSHIAGYHSALPYWAMTVVAIFCYVSVLAFASDK